MVSTLDPDAGAAGEAAVTVIAVAAEGADFARVDRKSLVGGWLEDRPGS